MVRSLIRDNRLEIYISGFVKTYVIDDAFGVFDLNEDEWIRAELEGLISQTRTLSEEEIQCLITSIKAYYQAVCLGGKRDSNGDKK